MTEIDGLAFLEQQAADVLARLDHDARTAHVAAQVAVLEQKFQTDFGTPAPKDMSRNLEQKAGAAFDTALEADFEALKNTTETLTAALARDIAADQELPDAVTAAIQASKLPGMSSNEQTALRTLEQLTLRNVRDELKGASVREVLRFYREALAAKDGIVLRELERQHKQGWPTITTPPEDLPVLQELRELVGGVRRSRVSPVKVEAHARASKVWSLQLDALYRLRKDGRLKLVGR